MASGETGRNRLGDAHSRAKENHNLSEEVCDVAVKKRVNDSSCSMHRNLKVNKFQNRQGANLIGPQNF